MKTTKEFIPIIFLLACFMVSGCEEQRPISLPKPPEKKEIVLSAMGDIMMPISIQKAAARNSFNYDFVFEEVLEDIASADIAFANLETPVDEARRTSGYPQFNARPELLTAIKKAGVKIVSLANNHALDAGPTGLKHTIENLEAENLLFCGVGRTRQEAQEGMIVIARDIRVGFLCYTYGTNLGMPRKKSPVYVNILRDNSPDDLASAVLAVKATRKKADLVVVSLHWSDEYRTEPNAWQRQAAAELIEAGADVILGHHPHVLQPVESYTTQNGRRGVIAYSLGNFVSSQNDGIDKKNKTRKKALRGDGIILKISATKEQEKTSITSADYVPIWTQRERRGALVLRRPVNIAREIGSLNTVTHRTKEEEDRLELLTYRKGAIEEAVVEKKRLQQN